MPVKVSTVKKPKTKPSEVIYYRNTGKSPFMVLYDHSDYSYFIATRMQGVFMKLG